MCTQLKTSDVISTQHPTHPIYTRILMYINFGLRNLTLEIVCIIFVCVNIAVVPVPGHMTATDLTYVIISVIVLRFFTWHGETF